MLSDIDPRVHVVRYLADINHISEIAQFAGPARGKMIAISDDRKAKWFEKLCTSFNTARADFFLHLIVCDDVDALDLALMNLQAGRHLRVANQIVHTGSAKRQCNSQEAFNQHTGIEATDRCSDQNNVALLCFGQRAFPKLRRDDEMRPAKFAVRA
ncbi:hypothetical protein RCCGEPOP_15823 [Rhizobium sp. Pop5]|nr:hypothetical protein RCCGEPOP_15823 [Rhizobium sp. Pop5]